MTHEQPKSPNPPTYAAAISYSRDSASLVGPIADELIKVFGRHAIFYDRYHESTLSRPDHEATLHAAYADAVLVVVVLSPGYTTSPWCQGEWEVIRPVAEANSAGVIFLNAGIHDLSPLRLERPPGLLEARNRAPDQLAQSIVDRFDSIGKPRFLMVSMEDDLHPPTSFAAPTPPHPDQPARLPAAFGVSRATWRPADDFGRILGRYRPHIVHIRLPHGNAAATLQLDSVASTVGLFSRARPIPLLIVSGDSPPAESLVGALDSCATVLITQRQSLPPRQTHAFVNTIMLRLSEGRTVAEAHYDALTTAFAPADAAREPFRLVHPEPAARLRFLTAPATAPAAPSQPDFADAPVLDVPRRSLRPTADDEDAEDPERPHGHASAQSPAHPLPPRQGANGRLWSRGLYWLAHIRPVEPVDFATVHDLAVSLFGRRRMARQIGPHGLVVIKPSGVLLGVAPTDNDTAALQRLFADLAALTAASPVRLATGVARGQCAQWPTPLLQQDVVGSGVVSAMAASAASAHVSRGHHGPGVTCAVLERPYHPILVDLGFDMVAIPGTAAFELVPKGSRTAASPAGCCGEGASGAFMPRPDKAAKGERGDAGAAADEPGIAHTDVAESRPGGPPGGTDLGAVGGDGCRSSPLDDAPPFPASAIRHPDAFALSAAVATSDEEALERHLSRLRRALRDHLPALASLATDPKQPGDSPVVLSHLLFFEFTGNGFRLVVYLPDAKARRIDLCDWLLTFCTEIAGWRTPVVLAATLGPQPSLRLGRWHAPVPASEPVDPATWCSNRTASPSVNPLSATLVASRALLLPELGLSAAGDGAEYIIDVGLARSSGSATLASLVQRLDALRVERGAAPVDLRDTTTLRPLKEGEASSGLRSPALQRAIQDHGSTIGRRASIEGVLVMLTALALSSPRPSLVRAAFLVGLTALVGWVFAAWLRRMYTRYVFVRLMPTLPRYHYGAGGATTLARESMVRSALRLRFGLAHSGRWCRLRRLSAVYREVGGGGTVFWLDHILISGDRRSLARRQRELPDAERRMPAVFVAVLGTAAYAGFALSVLHFKSWLRFDYLDGRFDLSVLVPVLVATTLGLAWNVCTYWRARKIPLYVLHLKERSYETILAEQTYRRPSGGELEVAAQSGKWLDFVNGLTHLVILALIAWGVGRFPSLAGWMIGFAALVVTVWSGFDSMRHLHGTRRAGKNWGQAFARGWLWRDGKDLFSPAKPPGTSGGLRDEIIPADAMVASMHVMTSRGDILADATWVIGATPDDHPLGRRGFVVATLPGHVLAVAGPPLAELGWTSANAPPTVDHLYADGTFAAKIVHSWARHMDNVTIDLEVLAAGPVINGWLRVSPVELRVIPIRPATLGGGYVALVTPTWNRASVPVRARSAVQEAADHDV